MECKGGNERKKTKRSETKRNKLKGTQGKDRNERIEMKGTK